MSLATGYTPTRLIELRALLEADIRSEWGAIPELADLVTDLGPSTRLGQILDIVAARLDETSDGLGEAYFAFDARNARGVYADNLADLTGTTREEARPSRVTLDLTGTPSVTLGRQQIVRSTATGTLWRTLDDVTFDGGGNATVTAQCTVTGPTAAAIGTITEIITPNPDWLTATNPDIATPGQERELDTDLLIRRRQNLQVGGSANGSAIAARVRLIEGITEAVVVDNDTDHTITEDGFILPFRSMILVAHPLTEPEIQEQVAETLWRNKPPGTQTIGSIEADVTDTAGITQRVRFDEPNAVTVDTNVTYESQDGIDLDAEVADAVVTYLGGLRIGETPRVIALACLILQIPGMIDATITFTHTPAIIGRLSRADVGAITF